MKAKTALKILAGVGICAAATAYVLAPGAASDEKKAPFMNRNFAHRGLHTEDKTIPENSLAAFRRAVEAGYGMELDVQLSKDGQVVVFHDDTLERMCGVRARVDELTLEELRELHLLDTEERIPLFTEVLNLVAGRTPIICELKSGRNNRELCEKTYDLIKYYWGDICIESFDPFIVSWFRVNGKDILRGQLAMPKENYDADGRPAIQGLLLSNTLLNCVGRPQFIAYKIGPKPLTVKAAEAMGAMKVGWTSHNAANEYGRDAVIFEYYQPDIQYREG